VVVAGLVELEIAEFVDEINAVKRTQGIEFPLQEFGGVGGVAAKENLNAVVTGLDVGEGEKPNHVLVDYREGASLDIGENP